MIDQVQDAIRRKWERRVNYKSGLPASIVPLLDMATGPQAVIIPCRPMIAGGDLEMRDTLLQLCCHEHRAHRPWSRSRSSRSTYYNISTLWRSAYDGGEVVARRWLFKRDTEKLSFVETLHIRDKTQYPLLADFATSGLAVVAASARGEVVNKDTMFIWELALVSPAARSHRTILISHAGEGIEPGSDSPEANEHETNSEGVMSRRWKYLWRTRSAKEKLSRWHESR